MNPSKFIFYSKKILALESTMEKDLLTIFGIRGDPLVRQKAIEYFHAFHKEEYKTWFTSDQLSLIWKKLLPIYDWPDWQKEILKDQGRFMEHIKRCVLNWFKICTLHEVILVFSRIIDQRNKCLAAIDNSRY